MTRAEIENLKLGDMLECTYDTAFGKALPEARYGEPKPVVEIIYRGYDVNGKAYVGFYVQYSEGCRMSGSITEGEEFYRLVKA